MREGGRSYCGVAVGKREREREGGFQRERERDEQVIIGKKSKSI